MSWLVGLQTSRHQNCSPSDTPVTRPPQLQLFSSLQLSRTKRTSVGNGKLFLEKARGCSSVGCPFMNMDLRLFGSRLTRVEDGPHRRHHVS